MVRAEVRGWRSEYGGQSLVWGRAPPGTARFQRALNTPITKREENDGPLDTFHSRTLRFTLISAGGVDPVALLTANSWPGKSSIFAKAHYSTSTPPESCTIPP